MRAAYDNVVATLPLDTIVASLCGAQRFLARGKFGVTVEPEAAEAAHAPERAAEALDIYVDAREEVDADGVVHEEPRRDHAVRDEEEQLVRPLRPIDVRALEEPALPYGPRHCFRDAGCRRSQ